MVSRRLPRKSLFTRPTLLKNLSGDAELTGTSRYCLVMWEAWELFLVLLPPDERVCVVGHLIHVHVGI
jgi:hypothetical protein